MTASSLQDLFRSQGYVQAQDRFWQMDTWRHIGAGRVAEMFGEGQVETDMFLRTLGFERLAAAEYEAMPADFREARDA
ncbi:MAG TPA: penicillin acylase family protein [Acidimicrobiia bacterium]|nr:penicillin acylase family protein [Acidimicrobiia bacterium]